MKNLSIHESIETGIFFSPLDFPLVLSMLSSGRHFDPKSLAGNPDICPDRAGLFLKDHYRSRCGNWGSNPVLVK